MSVSKPPPTPAAARVLALLADRPRVILGLCGPPGAGKSTLAAQLVQALSGESALVDVPAAVVVPLDGFHLHDAELARLNRSDRKGAPDTLDVGGYVALLSRLRSTPDETVYAPAFDRDRELSLAGAIPVLPSHRVVITEGNYLLLDTPGWSSVRPLLDECWFISVDDSSRRERLIERHVQHGRTRTAATEWVLRSDEANAVLVDATRSRADWLVDQPWA